MAKFNPRKFGIPRPPKSLKLRGREVWKALNAEYEFMIDQQVVLEEALRCMERADEAARLLDRDGLVVDGKPHPAWAIYRDSLQTLNRLWRGLHLDVAPPASTLKVAR